MLCLLQGLSLSVSCTPSIVFACFFNGHVPKWLWRHSKQWKRIHNAEGVAVAQRTVFSFAVHHAQTYCLEINRQNGWQQVVASHGTSPCMSVCRQVGSCMRSRFTQHTFFAVYFGPRPNCRCSTFLPPEQVRSVDALIRSCNTLLSMIHSFSGLAFLSFSLPPSHRRGPECHNLSSLFPLLRWTTGKNR